MKTVTYDPLYEEAVALVVKSRKASIPSIQRQLHISYNYAVRLVDQMETAGIVSVPEYHGNRTVLSFEKCQEIGKF